MQTIKSKRILFIVSFGSILIINVVSHDYAKIRNSYLNINISDNDFSVKVAEITNFRYIFVAEKIGEDQK